MDRAILPFDIQYLILDELSRLDWYADPQSEWRSLVEIFCVCHRWYSSLQQLLARNNKASSLLSASKIVGRFALERVAADYAAREKAIELAEKDESPLNWTPVTFSARNVPEYPDEDPLLIDLERCVIIAAYLGDVDSLRIGLDAGSDYDSVSSYLLEAAVEGEHIPVLEFLFDENYIDINCRTDHTSALGRAVLEERIPIVEFLLSSGADPNIRVSYFVTNFEHELNLVSFAAFKNNLELLKVLLSHGLGLEDPQYHRRPIWWAIRHDNLDMARLFIEKGVDLRASPDTISPLHDAVLYGQAEMVKLILEKGGMPEDADELGALYDDIDSCGDEEMKRMFGRA